MYRKALAIPIAALVALAACAGGEDGPADERIEITATSYAYEPSEIEVDRGTIRFVVHNDADIVHGFEVEGHGIEAAIEEIEPGATDSLTVTIETVAEYEIYCPVGDHEERGMTGSLDVR